MTISEVSNDPEWFVFHMMRVAERNNHNMARIFESIESAVCFEGASEGSECPMCLERFDSRHMLTLGCCHNFCHDCWKHWVNVMHALAKHPFCPTCSFHDFMGVVQSQVSRGRTPHIRLPDSNGRALGGGHACSRWASECWSKACADGPAASRRDCTTCFGDPWREPEQELRGSLRLSNQGRRTENTNRLPDAQL